MWQHCTNSLKNHPGLNVKGKCYNTGIVMETTESRESIDSSYSMKVSLYFPILDADLTAKT